MTDSCSEMRYSVLVYEDECGLWLKAPEFDLQICSEDFEVGMDLLEEQIAHAIRSRRARGEDSPKRFVRTVKHVGKDEYGPTQLDIEREHDSGGDE